MNNSRLSKINSIMVRLAVLDFRKKLKRIIPNISAFNDKQILELGYAYGAGVNPKTIANPRFSKVQMRKLRLDQEFGNILINDVNLGKKRDKYDNKKVNTI